MQATRTCDVVGRINEIGVVRDIGLNELRINIDHGRCSRPLFTVKEQRLLIKKKHIHSLQGVRCSFRSYCCFSAIT